MFIFIQNTSRHKATPSGLIQVVAAAVCLHKHILPSGIRRGYDQPAGLQSNAVIAFQALHDALGFAFSVCDDFGQLF